jgi:hypothetical protein
MVAEMAGIVDPFESQPSSIVDPFDSSKPTGPDEGEWHALGHGALAGATLNFSDELAGLRAAASPGVPDVLPVGPVPVPAAALQGAYRLGKNWLVGGDPDALAAYERARDAERAAQASAQQHHPYYYGAGEVAGALPAVAVSPEAGAAARLAPNVGRLARMGADLIDNVVAGSTYGAVSGAGQGTDAGSRVENSLAGTLGGAAAGVVGPAIGHTLGAMYDRFGQPIVSMVRGRLNPQAEAAQRVVGALDRDEQLIRAGQAQGLTADQWVAARNAGEPVTLADLGAGHTQSLLRSAANTSPEARSLLEKVLNDRFLNQSERVAADVRGLVAGGANANKTSDEMVAAYNAGRKPLYDKAYQEGDNIIMSPTMERLMGSPAFTQAMKGAVTSGQDRAVTEGFGAFNPGVTITPDGRIVFNRGPTGVPQFPNLQYWDAVKRELDDRTSTAFRSGNNEQGAVLQNMRNALRSELDRQVPSYKDARGFAADYFGAKDALQAGRDMAGKKIDPAEITKIMRKMKPDEQQLFREGYASDWANRVIGNLSNTGDITKALFNSTNDSKRALAVFGEAGLKFMEQRMALETIMNGARNALGNSTTARQLIEAGLAGGALSGYASGWDPGRMVEGFGSFALARKAPEIGERLGTHVVSQMAQSARHLIGRVDAKTAANVARLLTSDDPSELNQGLRLAASNQRIAQGLKRIANTVGVSSVAPSARESAIAAIPKLQSAARADDNRTDDQRLYVSPNR